jgi:hypothetical protein
MSAKPLVDPQTKHNQRAVDVAVKEAVEEERKRIVGWLMGRAKHTRSVKAQKALENAAEDLLVYRQ